MSIRSKLLIVLLLIAVLPMFIAVVVGQLSTRLVGQRLTRETQADLVSLAETRMLQGAQTAARLAGSEAQQINMVVMMQAQGAARALERARRDSASLPDIWLAREDFDGGRRPVPGLTDDADGSARPISLDVASFVFAPGVDPADHRADVAALDALAGLFPRLRRLNPDLIAGQHAATASGVHVAFPGHGGYPPNYDPRERPWYRLVADESGEGVAASIDRTPRWGDPYVDASTGRVIIGVSLPIVLADGSFAGVTGVDIALRSLINHFERQPAWSDREDLIVLSSLVQAHLEPHELAIYAQRSYDAKGGDWRRQIDLETFRLDDPVASRELIDRIAAGESGVVRSVRGGIDVLCAFAPVFAGETRTDVALAITVPFADIVAISDTIDREFWGVIVSQLSTNVAIASIVLALVVFFAFRGARSVTKPIEDVAAAVERVAGGDLDARADVSRDDEIGRLAHNFNTMVPKLRDRVKLRQSLDLAMEVQQALLPGAAPEVEGLDIDGHSIYCDETGGDYYDFMVAEPIDEQRLWLVMGDVTGHGIAAALLMTTARAIVRSRVGVAGSVAEHVNALNAQLSADNRHGRFMTLCVLLMDQATGRMRWVLAGHDPPIVYSPKTGVCRELDTEQGGIPLGIEPGWTYEECEGPMIEPGEVLVVGTDGIWEARNDRDELYGKERLRQVIGEHAAGSAREIREAIIEAVEGFRGATPQLDDITLLVVKAR